MVHHNYGLHRLLAAELDLKDVIVNSARSPRIFVQSFRLLCIALDRIDPIFDLKIDDGANGRFNGRISLNLRYYLGDLYHGRHVQDALVVKFERLLQQPAMLTAPYCTSITKAVIHDGVLSKTRPIEELLSVVLQREFWRLILFLDVIKLLLDLLLKDMDHLFSLLSVEVA